MAECSTLSARRKTTQLRRPIDACTLDRQAYVSSRRPRPGWSHSELTDNAGRKTENNEPSTSHGGENASRENELPNCKTRT